MKTKSIPFYERHIKLCIFAIVILISIQIYKLYLVNKMLSFELSILYAFLLFIFSVFSSLVSNQTESLFFKRQEHLINLIKLNSILKSELNLKVGFESLLNRLNTISVYTSVDNDNRTQSYVNPNYFSYTVRFNSVIEDYKNTFISLTRNLNESVSSSFPKSEVRSQNIICLDDFQGSVKDISSRYINETKLDIENQKNFEVQIEIFKRKNWKKILKIKGLYYFISFEIYITRKKVDFNIQTLNRMYGTRLAEDFERVNSILNSIYHIEDELVKVKQIVEYTEENVTSMNDILNCISNDNKIEEILHKVSNIDDNIGVLSQNIINISDDLKN